MRPDEIAQAAAKASGSATITTTLPKSFGTIQTGELLSKNVAKVMDGYMPADRLAKALEGATGHTITTTLPKSLGAVAVGEELSRKAAKVMEGYTPALSEATANRLAKALEGATGHTITTTLPKSFGTIQTGELLSKNVAKVMDGYMPADRLAKALEGATGHTITTTLPKSLGAVAVGEELSRKAAKVMEGYTSGVAVTPVVPGPVSIPDARPAPIVLSPEEIGRSDGESLSLDLRPTLLPEEVGELLATGLIRADRDDVLFLLTEVGLEDAREHLEEMEERLVTGTRASHLHAALSASLIMRDVADALFPPRDEVWRSRFNTEHALDAMRVGNRLSAFVDSHLRSELSTKQQRLFQATLDTVLDWAGEGHHVVRRPMDAAQGFRRLLEILAVVARAYRKSGD